MDTDDKKVYELFKSKFGEKEAELMMDILDTKVKPEFEEKRNEPVTEPGEAEVKQDKEK